VPPARPPHGAGAPHLHGRSHRTASTRPPRLRTAALQPASCRPPNPPHGRISPSRPLNTNDIATHPGGFSVSRNPTCAHVAPRGAAALGRASDECRRARAACPPAERSNLAVPSTQDRRRSHPPGWLLSFQKPQLRPRCAPWRGRPRPRVRRMRTRACRPSARRTVREHRARPGGCFAQPPPLRPRLQSLGLQPASRHPPSPPRGRISPSRPSPSHTRVRTAEVVSGGSLSPGASLGGDGTSKFAT